MSAPSPSLEFLTREGCSVCDEVLARLRVPARLLRVRIEEIDVDREPDLQARFGGRVPIVRVGGQVVAEGRATAGEAWRAVWRARKG